MNTNVIEREAACACGQLRIRVRGTPELVSSCHCLECQRRTGALFGSSAYFLQDRIVATSGESKVFQRGSEVGSTLAFHFCPNCGSNVYWFNSRFPTMLCIAIGACADPSFAAPARTIWTQTRHRWLSFPPEIPTHPKSAG